VAAIFFVVGCIWSDGSDAVVGPGQVNMKRKGLLAAFLLGLIFGVALGPARLPTWRRCWR